MSTRRELANAIRALSMDAVQQANCGHPGAPMGMADIAEVLWNDFLVHNPGNPSWPDRDRFVLSNGHGSMLIYSLLHLSGYDLPMGELRNFRQLHAKTPGHPEYGYAPGVETTTGPLGQGICNAVGMALAEKVLAAQFNRDGHAIVDHYTYCFLGDGCLMEGVSHEACSLAGTQGLGKLIAIYDDNGISIDGEVDGWFTDDTPARFKAYGWQVIESVDGHDPEAIKAAITEAKAEGSRPTLICAKTVIGFGSPNKQGTSGVHGAALGDSEVAATRAEIGWEHAPFEIPQSIYDGWDAKSRGAEAEQAWQAKFNAYQRAHPELAAEFERRISGEVSDHFLSQADEYIAQCQAAGESPATRKASQNCLNAYGPHLPELIGGSADLAGSNNTIWSGSEPISASKADGNYLYFGVREFGMSAMMNGMALHGGFIPYGATFLVFMEYARNAVRMAALMQQRAIFVYTHDSIGLGEDGPTHQPVEQLANLRSTPNLHTWRPCDTVESAVCWKQALTNKTSPSALVFTRQGLAHQQRGADQVADIARGGYVLRKESGALDGIVIATGSEVQLAIEAAETMAQRGKQIRVVSMPCTTVFDQQDAAYKESVLPAAVLTRVAVEAAHVDFWYKYVGLDGRVVGMTTFGESAPAGELFKHFGITTDAIVAELDELLAD